MADSGMIDLVINVVLKVFYPQDVHRLVVILVFAYFNRSGAALLVFVFLLLIELNYQKKSCYPKH